MRLTVGAYAAARRDWGGADLASFYAAVAGLPAVGRLELPAAQLGELAAGLAARPPLAGRLDYEVTSLPATMSALRAAAGYGLASADPDGRAAAVADAERMRAAVTRFNDRLGRAAVRAVTLVSAPARAAGAPAGRARAAFAASLGELGSRDWGGARLVVEHCDAAVPGQAHAKGFLDLASELDVLAEVTAAGTRAVINWGRSVIERRDPAAAAVHAGLARDRGLLAGVVLSGCAATASGWGAAWADTHLPPAGVSPAGGAAHESLLTRRRMTGFLRAAGPDARVSVKLSVRPGDAGHRTRAAFVAAALDEVRLAWAAARATTASSADWS